MDLIRGYGEILELKRHSIAKLRPSIGESVLDLGCGTGEDVRIFADLTSPGGKIWGIDSSQTMIDEARRRTQHKDGESRNTEINFILGDIHTLPQSDASIDICWCERTLQHVKNPSEVLSEIARVLTDKGRAIILDTDWETFTIDSDNHRVTRKIVNGFSDSILNGAIGRKLPRLVRSTGLQTSEIFCKTIHSNDYSLLFDVMNLKSCINELVSSKELSKIDAEDWLREMDFAKQRQNIFFAVTVFGVFARKAR